MATQSYSKSYLAQVSETLGIMFEHAVDIGNNPIIFWNTFVNSNVAKQIQNGNPKYLTCSAIDYLKEILNAHIEDKEFIDRDEYYWAGWALAQYQFKSGKSFFKINSVISIDKVLDLYPILHEADITKFYNVMDEYFAKVKEETNLKQIRNAAGLSQSELAKKADVELRSIQMYEQRRNDINKAQVDTLRKLAIVLGCNIEDLLEI